MKKLLSLMLILMLSLTLVACGGKKESELPVETPSNTTPTEENAGTEVEDVDWPTGAVTIYVGAKTGGNLDVKARILAEYLKVELGESVVIENVPGNSGAVVLTQFLVQQPNSNSLCYTGTDSLNVVPLFQETEYTNEDYITVACTDEVELGLFASASSGITSLADLKTAFASDTCIFSAVGAGNISYILPKGILNTMEVNSDFITDNGYGEAMVNVAGGNADICLSSMTLAKSYIESGNLVPLCVLSANAYEEYADIGIESVPSAVEQGYEFQWSNLSSLMMRGGTDDAVIAKLETALETIFANEEYRKAMIDAGFELVDDHSSSFVQGAVSTRVATAVSYAEIAGMEVLG